MGKNVQGGGNSTDDGPEAGVQREGRAYDLVGRGHGRAGVTEGSVSALPSALLLPAPLCVNPKLPAPTLTFLSPQTGLCTAPNLWGWCPLSTKCSLLSLTLERGPSTLQCRGSGARPPEFIV